MNFTIGADPEFGILYKNQFKSAIDFLPDKKKASKVNGNLFYFDNVLAEIGLQPTTSKEKFILTIQNALGDLTNLLYPAKLLTQASMQFSANELKHKKAIEAGCEPEVSAYTLKQVDPPQDYVTDYFKHVTPFRTAGGHIHLGAECLQQTMLVPYTAKMLDLFLAIPELFFNKDKTAKDRRRVYGLAGTHRPKPYGLEYRSLSNYWLSSPIYAGLIYDLCEFVLQFIMDEGHLRFWNIDETLLEDDDPAKAHQCIGYNVELLREAIDTINLPMAEPFLLIIMNYLPNHIIHDFEKAVKYNPKELEDEWAI